MLRAVEVVLCVFAAFAALFEAKVTVEFKLKYYANVDKRDWRGQDCEALSTSGCDTFINVCMDRHNGSHSALISHFRRCAYFSKKSQIYHNNPPTIYFTTGDDVNGLPNPITFEIGNWERGFLVKVSTFDGDRFTRDDLIDLLYSKYTMMPNKNRTAAGLGTSAKIAGSRESYKTELSVNLLVYCSEYYFYNESTNDPCSVYCKPDNSSTGHYECTETGVKICFPGWTNPATNCTESIDDCASIPCQNGGTCVDEHNGYSCNCTKQYSSMHCEESVPDPCLAKPCQKGGSCTWVQGGFMCTCPADWTGMDCSLSINSLEPASKLGDSSDNDNDKNKGNWVAGSPWIIGVIVGFLLLLLIIVLLLALLLRSRRRRKLQDKSTAASIDTNTAGQQTATDTATAGTATYDNPLFHNGIRAGAGAGTAAGAGVGTDDHGTNTYSEVNYDIVKVPLTDGYDVPRAISAKQREAEQPAAYYDARLRYSPKSSKAPMFPQDGGVRGGFSPMGTDPHLYRQPVENRFDNPTYDAPNGDMGAAGGSSVKKMANLYDEPIKFKL